MASLNFDASTIDTSSHDPIKPGTYEAVIAETEMRPTRNGDGMGINVTFEIISGEAKGRKVWEWINYQHPKPEAQRIGQETLAKICKAVGVERLTETEQLHNIPLLVKVALDKADPTKNTVKDILAKSKVAAAAAPAAAPAAAAPAAQPAAGGDDPWAR